MNIIIIILGKLISSFSLLFNLGNGSTWPGHIALKINPHFIQNVFKNSEVKIILIAGTNGKTTTALLLKTILEQNGKKVIHNISGANLLNGIASAIILQGLTWRGQMAADYTIFEVDENVLPKLLKEIDPQYIVLLNLFRDQLDRYGEVASIARKWTDALFGEEHIKIILNADDPEVAFIGQKLFNHKNVKYFGMEQPGKKIMEHAVDSIYCPRCSSKLKYLAIYYSHLGKWICESCDLKRPQLAISEAPYLPLSGLYNTYNTLAAVLTAKELGMTDNEVLFGLKAFKPAFGRQEVVQYQGKKINIFLSKNPAGFNQSLQTIKDLGAKHVLLALNDRIADGKDVSWIWDIDTEVLNDFAENIVVTGDRCFDMALRLKYSLIPNTKYLIQSDTKTAIIKALEKIESNDVLFVLPTYTAMLDIRKILSGKKIL